MFGTILVVILASPDCSVKTEPHILTLLLRYATAGLVYTSIFHEASQCNPITVAADVYWSESQTVDTVMISTK